MTQPRLILEVRLGPRRGTKVALGPGQAVSVGRTDACDLIVPEDGKLSPRHFLVTWDGSAARVEDLGSATGTQLNGETRPAAELGHGGWIRAGETDFTIHVEARTPAPPEEDEPEPDQEREDEPPLSPFPTEPGAPSAEDDEEIRAVQRRSEAQSRELRGVVARLSRRERLHREEAADRALPVLRAVAEAGALHAVLDAARSDRILQVLREAVEEHRSLYEGVKGIALEDVSPYLVRLPADSRLLAQLVREGWMRRWGIFLEGPVPARELRRHLRRFLMSEAENGEPLYFRYYDPACLRDFWPTCSKRQLTELCGPIGAFLVEGERGEVLRLTEDGRVLPVEAAS